MRAWYLGVLLAMVVVTGRVAMAQPSPQFMAEFQAGTDAYRLGDYAKARGHLERAMAIEPSLPGPPRFLAAVDAAEGKFADCVAHARTAIIANPASSEIAATRKVHDDCRVALDRPPFSGDYAGGGALLVITNISGAAITINGLRAGATPLPPRAIGLGPVEVSASKTGWKTATASATIIPGVVTDLELVLEEDPGTVVVDRAPEELAHGWLRIDAPAGAVISIDASTSRTVDERGRYELPAGEHVVDVSAEGFLPYRRTVRIERGQEQVVVVPRDSASAQARRRRLGTIALGSAAGLAAIGVVTGWMAVRTADEARDWANIERARPPALPLPDTAAIAPIHTRAQIEDKADRARTLGLVSGIAYVASGVALGAGIYFLSRSPASAVEVSPAVGDGWGLSVRGALP